MPHFPAEFGWLLFVAVAIAAFVGVAALTTIYYRDKRRQDRVVRWRAVELETINSRLPDALDQ